jgi:hypothetical protein
MMDRNQEYQKNIKSTIVSKRTVMVDKAFHYRCTTCGHEEVMWLEKGLENFGRPDHQPVPFSISCKFKGCKGFMNHVEWNKDIYLGEPRPLKEGESWFEYDYKNPGGCGDPHKMWVKGAKQNA